MTKPNQQQIQQQIELLKDLSHYYNNTDSRYIYFDKTFDIRGINYNQFIQLKYEPINNKHIKDIYTIDGWYLLWYLMSRATKNEYIATTINSISEETNFKPIKIKEVLTILKNSETILTTKKLATISNTELLHIYIGYNNNLSPHSWQNGYTPIPSEFIYYIIPTLTPTEWAIYTVLLTKYNYYLAWEEVDKSTGEIIPLYQRTHYAFPVQSLISEYIGTTEETISKFTKKLINNKYNLITSYTSNRYSYYDKIENKHIWKGGNKRYLIKLYERPEYIYYYLNNSLNKQEQDDFNYIRKKKFDKIALSHEQELIRNKKQFYIKYYYGEILDLYDKCIQEQDQNLYETIRKTYTITP